MVDETENYGQAARAPPKLIGIKGEPQVITPPKPKEGFTLLDLFLGVTKLSEFSPSQLPKHLSDIDTSVKFKYQWK